MTHRPQLVHYRHPALSAPTGLPVAPRLLTYAGLWLLAAVAIQIFLQPEGSTESTLSPMQQHLLWLPYTPLMIVVGLAQAVTWPNHVPDAASWAAVAVLVIHAVVAFTRHRRASFLALAAVQALLLAVAVIYFVRQSYLPTGG